MTIKEEIIKIESQIKEIFDIDNFTQKDFYEIAKIIDNDFFGTFETFTAEKIKDFYYLSTNRVDSSSIIKVYSDKITLINDSTSGFQEIQPDTKLQILNWIKENK